MADEYKIDYSILQRMAELARKDSDFDLFYRRFIMADRMLHCNPDQLQSLPNQPWYCEYWKLVGEHKRTTKFDEQEKSIREQTIRMLGREQNPGKRQLFALVMLMFGELQTALPMFNQQLLPPKILQDLQVFIAWNTILEAEIQGGDGNSMLDCRRSENTIKTSSAFSVQNSAA